MTVDSQTRSPGSSYAAPDGTPRLARLMSLRARGTFDRYGFAVACTLAAGAIVAGLHEAGVERGTFTPLVLAVVLSTWYGGTRAGLLAAFLGLFGGYVVLIPDRYGLSGASWEDAVSLALFVAVALLTGQIYEIARQAERRSQASFSRAREGIAARDAAIRAHRGIEEQLTALVEASGSLIESLELEQMLPRILALAKRLVAADAYAIWGVTDERDRWRVLAAEGLSQEHLRTSSVIEITPETPAMDRELVVEDIEADPMLGGRVDALRREGVRSLLVMPVMNAGELNGTLTFYYRRRYRCSAAEVRVATGLANLAAAAIAGAKLYRQQARSRETAEAANSRLRFLSQASALLAESLDYESRLQRLADLAVPEIADWCVVRVIALDGTGRDMAVAHSDPAKVTLARALLERYRPDADAAHGYAQVLRSGRYELIEEISDEHIRQVAHDEEHYRVLRELGPRSSLVVPLTARGRILGAITLVMADSQRTFRQDDVALAEDLAHRAAVAIDNAQLLRETQATAADLARANAAKDEFLGMVSHELKTPITVILGNADVLHQRGEALDRESRQQALADVRSEADRLNRLIENMLTLARLESGAETDREPIIVRRLVKRIADEHRRAWPDRRIELTMDGEPTPVSSDGACIEQVLRNLLSNAEKYSPPSAPIEIDVRRDGEDLIVSVRDHGPGIAPEEAEKIFVPFYRSPRTSGHAQGIGIGLAVCRRLVEAQSGRIWARPAAGGGGEFGFALPVIHEEVVGEQGRASPADAVAR